MNPSITCGRQITALLVFASVHRHWYDEVRLRLSSVLGPRAIGMRRTRFSSCSDLFSLYMKHPRRLLGLGILGPVNGVCPPGFSREHLFKLGHAS